jgi:hypothetical protein
MPSIEKTPLDIKFNANRATIGDISIIPSGGMNFLKNPRYGSVIFSSIWPNFVSRAEGTQDIKM